MSLNPFRCVHHIFTYTHAHSPPLPSQKNLNTHHSHSKKLTQPARIYHHFSSHICHSILQPPNILSIITHKQQNEHPRQWTQLKPPTSLPIALFVFLLIKVQKLTHDTKTPCQQRPRPSHFTQYSLVPSSTLSQPLLAPLTMLMIFISSKGYEG